MRRLLPAPASTEVDLDEHYGLPPGRHVRGNMVASLDGLTQADGVSGGLSGEADRRVFATLRGLTDVVLVGAQTARAENYGPARPSPQRRARRAAAGLPEVPPIAVVSARLDLDPGGRLFTGVEVRPIVLTCASAPGDARERLAEVADVVVVAGDRRVDMRSALDALADRGLEHVLCEGGAALLGQLVADDRLDELCLTVSPLVLGGDGGRRIIAGPALPAPARARLAGVLESDGFLLLRYAMR